eukprot:c8265_g1_i1.p1 GENE.c8265_g1_i1~~c8265_g1_i1.p1  ORF type:complete len:103 (+),score=35.60 c8265_g1_i1:26-310(+)
MSTVTKVLRSSSSSFVPPFIKHIFQKNTRLNYKLQGDVHMGINLAQKNPHLSLPIYENGVFRNPWTTWKEEPTFDALKMTVGRLFMSYPSKVNY